MSRLQSLPRAIRRYPVLLPVFGGLIARLAYWGLITPNWVPRSDAYQYVELARSLANGHGYSSVFPQLTSHPTAFRPPLYPLLLTIPTWIFGNALWPARLLSLLLGLGVIALTYKLTQRIGGGGGSKVRSVGRRTCPNPYCK